MISPQVIQVATGLNFTAMSLHGLKNMELYSMLTSGQGSQSTFVRIKFSHPSLDSMTDLHLKELNQYANGTENIYREIINAKQHKAKKYIVHGFEDPSEDEGSEEEKREAFRKIRDQFKARIEEYFADPAKMI